MQSCPSHARLTFLETLLRMLLDFSLGPSGRIASILTLLSPPTFGISEPTSSLNASAALGQQN